jgi:hypothetical protein
MFIVVSPSIDRRRRFHLRQKAPAGPTPVALLRGAPLPDTGWAAERIHDAVSP